MYMSRKGFTARDFCILVLFASLFVNISLVAYAQPAPGLLILSPAGALNPNSTVSPSFVVSFTLVNFELAEPGIPGMVNKPNQGHIHVFLDDTYYALWINENPIPFSNLSSGNHTIKLQLVNNDHSVLNPDVSKTIAISVTEAPSGQPSLRILSPAGALNTDTNVATSFKVSFIVNNFTFADPVGQPNALNTGHIHVFIDEKYYVLWTSTLPIPFDSMAQGQHTIKLQLVTNRHSPLNPDVSTTITVNVQAPLQPLADLVNMVYQLSLANIGVSVLLLIVVIILCRRK